MRGFIPPQNESEILLCKKAENAITAAQKSGSVRIMPFMNERQQALCQSVLNRLKCNTYTFYGGGEYTERAMLAIGDTAPDVSVFNIEMLLITAKFSKGKLTHRDYLGAIMSLNITRDNIGDIILCEQGALLYTTAKFARLICDELTQVKNVNVSVSIGKEKLENPIYSAKQQNEKTLTIASLRLDAIIAAMLKISRAKAAALIRTNSVMINHIATKNPAEEVQQGDVFSIKGKGKYKLSATHGKSKKDRIFISFIEY